MSAASPMLTTAEAGDYLRFTASGIRRLVLNGELSPDGVGRRHTFMFRRETLDSFLAARLERKRRVDQEAAGWQVPGARGGAGREDRAPAQPEGDRQHAGGGEGEAA